MHLFVSAPITAVPADPAAPQVAFLCHGPPRLLALVSVRQQVTENSFLGPAETPNGRKQGR